MRLRLVSDASSRAIIAARAAGRSVGADMRMKILANPYLFGQDHGFVNDTLS